LRLAFGGVFDPSASGPTNPNMLTYNYTSDAFSMPVGFAVTIPRSGKYTITLRVRGNSGDHSFTALYDNKPVFTGAFGIEGEDWNMIGLPAMDLSEGVHYLELQMKLGNGPRPLDLDLVLLTDAHDFHPRQCLRAYPDKLEVRP